MSVKVAVSQLSGVDFVHLWNTYVRKQCMTQSAHYMMRPSESTISTKPHEMLEAKYQTVFLLVGSQ